MVALRTALSTSEHTRSGPFWLPEVMVANITPELWLILIGWAAGKPLATVEQSRREIIRFFVLFHLALKEDSPRRRRDAALACLDWIHANAAEHADIFPGSSLYADLVGKGLSHPLVEPPREPPKLAEWRKSEDRFPQELTAHILSAWWDRGRYFLPWLQREYIVRNFPGYQPLRDGSVGRPWDEDHICPRHSWNLDGRQGADAPGLSSKESWWDIRERARSIGESVGNLRLVDRATNRGDGDAPFAEKWKRWTEHTDGANANGGDPWIIPPAHVAEWIMASSARSKVWETQRRETFQWVVEARALHLYDKLFYDLELGMWL